MICPLSHAMGHDGPSYVEETTGVGPQVLQWRYGPSAANPRLKAPQLSDTAGSRKSCAADCFPHASPAPVSRTGKQKAAPRGRSNHLICLVEIGAGEGIRTLDPDLGKV
jgi:hypothetical protein